MQTDLWTVCITGPKEFGYIFEKLSEHPMRDATESAIRLHSVCEIAQFVAPQARHTGIRRYQKSLLTSVQSMFCIKPRRIK